MSFAVSKNSAIYAWGLNKNNCLLTNDPGRGFVHTLVHEPERVVLPDYFHR